MSDDMGVNGEGVRSTGNYVPRKLGLCVICFLGGVIALVSRHRGLYYERVVYENTMDAGTRLDAP